MTWRTHVAVGANAIWLAGIYWQVDQSILVLLPVAIIASLLPDIDATRAKIHFVAGGTLGLLKGSFHGKYFHHRGIMHSLAAVGVLYFILWLIFHNSLPALPVIFAASYLSHCIIDGFNTNVGYFYPIIYKRFALLPKSLLARVGSPIDTLLMFVGLAGLLIFMAFFANVLISKQTFL